jgi:hypothetical protein
MVSPGREFLVAHLRRILTKRSHPPGGCLAVSHGRCDAMRRGLRSAVAGRPAARAGPGLAAAPAPQVISRGGHLAGGAASQFAGQGTLRIGRRGLTIRTSIVVSVNSIGPPRSADRRGSRTVPLEGNRPRRGFTPEGAQRSKEPAASQLATADAAASALRSRTLARCHRAGPGRSWRVWRRSGARSVAAMGTRPQRVPVNGAAVAGWPTLVPSADAPVPTQGASVAAA